MREFSLIFCLFATTRAFAAPAEEAAAFFRQKLLPVLENRCFECHSARSERVKGGLRLDSPEALRKGGDTGAIVVPGDPDNSKIVIAVRHSDPDLKMPPKEKLAPNEVALFEEWVRMGAPDPRESPGLTNPVLKQLWSTQPIRQPEPPRFSDPLIHDPIDAFVRAERERHNVTSVPRADKQTLIRRATFDLTGLPPTPDEVEEFLNDSSDQAFARAVDRLLKSPHFGERWGRHWLDIARYADSNGLDQIGVFNDAWRYRQYVVDSFNSDKSFREFIIEQLAGDLLPFTSNADRHQKWIATGFLVLGPKNVSEPDREKLLMDVVDEQIDVTTRGFLGLTVSCARCHDHKFDPIPTRDYYAMAGIFRSTQTVPADRSLARDNGFLNQRPLGTLEQSEETAAYQKRLAELERKRDRARRMAQDLPGGIDSNDLDGIVVDNLEAELIGEWKLSNYATNFVNKNYLHDGNEKSGKGKKSVRFRPVIPQDGLYEVRLAYTARLNRATNVPVRVELHDGSKTVYLNQTVEPKYDKAFESLGFFKLEKGTNNIIELLTDGTKGFVVVDAVQCLPQDIQLAAALKKRSPPETEEEAMMSDITAARREEFENAVFELMAKAPPPMPMAIAVQDGEIRNSRIHVRGDPSRLGEEVPRGFLTALGTLEAKSEIQDSSGRLPLAKWIASDKNPLTARVMVNRIWLHLFGKGLVHSADNFGLMGELPTHPELLDYLASEFMADEWSVKHLIRRIMLTSTYQLSTAHHPSAHAADPENRLLWRMNRKRLDAEALRDAILVMNQTLDRNIGGPSLSDRPGAGPAPGDRSVLLSSRRRSLYLPVFRGSLNDLFQVFDFPDPHALAGQRYITTAPTQSLFLMNSPFILRECETWTENLLHLTGRSDADLIQQVYRQAYSRPSTPEELAQARTFLRAYESTLIVSEPEAKLRRKKAYQAFCQAIIQSTEFRFLN